MLLDLRRKYTMTKLSLVRDGAFRSNLINKSAPLSAEVRLFTVSTLYALHAKNKLHYDRERLQRLLVPWSLHKKYSYIKYLFNGGNYKDLFQIAEIKSIVDSLKDILKSGTKYYGTIKDNLDYFEELVKKGYEYIVLDGQHRIETLASFLQDEIELQSRGEIIFEDKEISSLLRVEGKFSSLPEKIKDLFRSTNIIVTVYKTGDLKELAQIFITSNDMLPMTDHEKRILNYNALNRWIVKYCVNNVNLHNILSIVNSMSGEYSLDSKGDTLIVAEMLMYLNDNNYEGYDVKVLNDALGPTPSITISNSTRELAKNIFDIISVGCIQLNEKHLKKFSRSSIYDLFYTLSFLMQKGNKWAKKVGIENLYKVNDPYGFVKWFFDEQYRRMNTKGTFIYFKSSNSSKQKKQVHDYSFRKHLSDQAHSRKISIKGEGGSEYDFDSWARVLHILHDLKNSLTQLENQNIISRVGTRTDTSDLSRDEAIVAAGIPLSESDDYHVHEIIPVSKGGSRTANNTAVIKKELNLAIGNKPNKLEPIGS